MKTARFLLSVIILFCIINMNAQTYDEDVELAGTYYSKGVEYKNKYDLENAEQQLNKALGLFEKHEVWDNYLIVSNELGIVLLMKGDVKNAIKFYNGKIALAIEKFGESNEYLAGLYNSLGRAYFFQGNSLTALDLFNKEMAVRMALGDKESVFMSNLYNDMGNAYAEQGEYDLALDYYKKALSIRQKVLGEQHPETALSYNNIGIIYKEKAYYDKAIEFHQKAVDIHKAVLGEEHPELANYYQNIGNAYKAKIELDQALEYYYKAYSIRVKAYTENHPNVAQDLINIAAIYSEKGDNENGLDNLLKALKIQKQTMGDKHPDLATTYNNLGTIYEKDGQPDQALSFYMNALDIKKANYGENHPDIADYYTNIGNIYASKDDADLALENYYSAMSLKLQFYGSNHPAVALPYLNIGQVYYAKGEFNDALSNYQKSLISNVKSFAAKPDDDFTNPVIADYYNARNLLSSFKGKAASLVGMYKTDKNVNQLIVALECYKKCDTLINIIRRSSTSKKDKIELGKISSKLYDEAIDVCFKLDQLKSKSVGDYYLQEAFYFSEKNKAGVLLEALASSDAKKFAGIPDELLEKERALTEEIAGFEQQLAEAWDENTEQKVRDELFKVNRKYDELIKSFEENYPEYFQMKHNKKTVTIEQLRTLLDDNTAIQSYFIGDSLISIFTVTTDRVRMEKSAVDEGFNFKIFGFRNALTTGNQEAVKQYQEDAYFYYKLLFPAGIPKGIKRMIIIPDGNLGMIPFEALLTEKYTGKWNEYFKYPFLINDLEISYNYSAGLSYIQNDKRNDSISGNWLGVAPVFSNVNNLIINESFITPLPASEKEIETIKMKFESSGGKIEAKLFDAASEQFLKSPEIKEFDYLHIATHGFVNSEKPELSGIILSPVKDGGNDGVLYSGEIYSLELNADLVVLSACETALGKVSKGEGIIGLSRALLYAGTNNIMVSLWKVADESTSKLMIDFYDELLKKEDRLNTAYTKSLHAAKQKMAKSKKFSHPFFWSPFVLIGQ